MKMMIIMMIMMTSKSALTICYTRGSDGRWVADAVTFKTNEQCRDCRRPMNDNYTEGRAEEITVDPVTSHGESLSAPRESNHLERGLHARTETSSVCTLAFRVRVLRFQSNSFAVTLDAASSDNKSSRYDDDNRRCVNRLR